MNQKGRVTSDPAFYPTSTFFLLNFSNRKLCYLLSICTINQLNLLHISISYLTNMANTVLESQNSFQTTDHLHIQNQYTNTPVQHRSFHVGPRLTINMAQNILKQPFLQFFKTVTVNGIFTPMIHLIPVIQSARPVLHPASTI